MKIVCSIRLESADLVPGSFCLDYIIPGPNDLYQISCSQAVELPLKTIDISALSIDAGDIFSAVTINDIFVLNKNNVPSKVEVDSGQALYFERPISTGSMSKYCVSALGHVLSVGYEPWTFDFFDPGGRLITAGYELCQGRGKLELPVGLPPIWSQGCSTVSANKRTFIVGGGPADKRLDLYSLDGSYIRTIVLDETAPILEYGFGAIANAVLRPEGDIILTDGFSIMVLSPTGECLDVFTNLIFQDMRLLLEEVFFIDARNAIWSICVNPNGAEAFLVAIVLG